MSKRVGLFGGSFNPPHVAHQLAALYVLETQPIDELWWLPTYSHPFGKHLVSYDQRVAMCEAAVADLGARVKVSRAEEELAQQPGFVASRTLDLLEYLDARDAGTTFRWVIGGDILGEAAKWYRWDDVCAKAPLIVVGRTGHPLPPGASASGLMMPEVSSTRVRELLAQGHGEPHARELLGQLLPASVLRYIAEHRLYLPVL